MMYSASHLITLVALASTLGGIVRPICLAVFRLMTKLELHRLLHWNIGRFRSLEDLVNEDRSTAV